MKHWKIRAVNEAKREFNNLPLSVRTDIREMLRREAAKEIPRGAHLVQCRGWFMMAVGKYRVVYAPYHEDEIHILLITAVGTHGNIFKSTLAERFEKYG